MLVVIHNVPNSSKSPGRKIIMRENTKIKRVPSAMVEPRLDLIKNVLL